MSEKKWFLPSGRAGELRLFGFPYAGGGAALFRALEAELPERVAVWGVRPPGRETRFGEEPFRRVSDFVTAFLPVLEAHLETPFVFLGHSMGAVLAFEVARELRRRSLPLPQHLFLAARRAPDRPEPEPIYTLADPAFLDALKQLYGTGSGLFEYPELLELMVPTLKADVELNCTYQPSPEPPLPVAASVWGGEEDRSVSREDLEGWRPFFSGPCAVRLLPGDHFFLATCPQAVAQAVREALGL